MHFIANHLHVVSEVAISATQSTEGSIVGLAHKLECTFLVTTGVSPDLVNINWNISALLSESARINASNLTNNYNGSLYTKTITFLPLLSHDSGKYTCYAEITGFSETMSSESLIVMVTGICM